MKKLLEGKEVQELLGIHQNTMYRLQQKDPTFPIRKICGKWKADPDELEAWVKSQNTFTQERQEPIRRGRPCLSGTSPKRAAR